ncbi:hypothetical protein PV327_004843 [Microctonus hyperodae]|uniref:Uncharacterized protein n=1 Tax=Microctonus hyperodae TaxID=165561 RepID=A0AA39FDA4_MICHY|nr:hypothetical protein PV327_004843 [Microctonus hyperodae]
MDNETRDEQNSKDGQTTQKPTVFAPPLHAIRYGGFSSKYRWGILSYAPPTIGLAVATIWNFIMQGTDMKWCIGFTIKKRSYHAVIL